MEFPAGCRRPEGLTPLIITSRPCRSTKGDVPQCDFNLVVVNLDETTIAELKRSLDECQQLSHRGKLLSNDRLSLRQCGLSAYSQLTVVLNHAALIGGMADSINKDDHFFAVKSADSTVTAKVDHEDVDGELISS